MSFKVGDKAIVALGKFRGADRYNMDGNGSLPYNMLPDGTIVTITVEANGRLWYSVEECQFNYPPSLLLPYNKKLIMLQAMKDFK